MAKARLTLLHIVRSLLLVLLVPLQFVSSLPSRHLQFHRWTGRLILVLGVVLGVSALLLSVRPDGVAVEGMATIWFGCFLLVCLGRAWWHLRGRRLEAYREWVSHSHGRNRTRRVAWTGPIIAVFFATSPLTGLMPERFFGPAMWLGFTAAHISETWFRRTARS